MSYASEPMSQLQTSIYVLIATLILIAACGKPTIPVTQVSDPVNSKSAEPVHVEDATVDFEGVSFRYDANTFGDLKYEVVPVYPLHAPDEKPDGVAPEHILFTFALGREYSKAHIAVYPLNEFPEAYSVSPELIKGMKEKIEGLRKVLQDPSFRLDDEIPRLPYRDAGDNFYVKVRHFDFENGDGIIFVTHWMHGLDLVSNRNLLYRFEGVTRDGKYYVTGEMPVSVNFLPDDTPNEFEGYTYENLYDFSGDPKTYNDRNPTQRYRNYMESISNRLEKLQSREFSPNLEKFESVISSLQITDRK
jgi:hypothetical protein